MIRVIARFYGLLASRTEIFLTRQELFNLFSSIVPPSILFPCTTFCILCGHFLWVSLFIRIFSGADFFWVGFSPVFGCSEGLFRIILSIRGGYSTSPFGVGLIPFSLYGLDFLGIVFLPSGNPGADIFGVGFSIFSGRGKDFFPVCFFILGLCGAHLIGIILLPDGGCSADLFFIGLIPSRRGRLPLFLGLLGFHGAATSFFREFSSITLTIICLARREGLYLPDCQFWTL